MRSDLIFGAMAHVRNRYELCHLAMLATRKLHKPTTRVEDTTNEVLNRFRYADPSSAPTPTAPAASVQQHHAA